MDKKSTVPSTGNFDENWPAYSNFTQGQSGLLSAAGWTYGNEGFIQQTFLGASIRSFNITAGFGTTSSSLSVDLVEDEYNQSDKTGLGLGDDVYHSGSGDIFSPPAVGSPVFFKFGKIFTTTEQAWRPTLDEIYHKSTIPVTSGEEVKYDSIQIPVPANEYLDLEKSVIGYGSLSGSYTYIKNEVLNPDAYYEDFDNSETSGVPLDNQVWAARGKDHFVFGGILQSFVQSRGVGGNPLYTVQVEDPREILSNTVVILNNYAGSVYDNKNYINVYGFLEYDISSSLKKEFDSINVPGYIKNGIESVSKWQTPGTGILGELYSLFIDGKKDNILEKRISASNSLQVVADPQGTKVKNSDYVFSGTDMFRFSQNRGEYPEFFPMTGEGFSRVTERGMPWYRIRQAIDALFEINGELPEEYREKKFGGVINFRGYNYIVDLSGLPLEKIPDLYFIENDQIDLFSLLQDVCDFISHDIYVRLLPIVSHPKYYTTYVKNEKLSELITSPNQTEEVKIDSYSKFIAGVIRVEAIDRSKEPSPGVIKDYLEKLSSSGIYVETQDLGYELANLDTDKIVVGAQTSDIYFFSSHKDRDNLQVRKLKNGDSSNKAAFLLEQQWLLETSLKQQVLPFYGFLGKDAVTIPIGFGSYQQILLDATGLDAHGVGDYYIATEIELRAALISYEQWARFLLQYNEVYMEEIGENYIFWKELAKSTPENANIDGIFNPDDLANREFGVSVPRCVYNSEKNYMGSDGYPASPCSPPFGYPLYYKRAEKIGIPEAGIVNFQNALTKCLTNYENLKKSIKNKDDITQIKSDKIDTAINHSLKFISKLYNNFQYDQDLLRKTTTEIGDIFHQIDKYYEYLESKGVATVVRDTLISNKEFFKVINNLSRVHLNNAKKVYNFVRSVAEKHLGKTFLVKIPKKCNPRYNKDIVYLNPSQSIVVKDIYESPFGFKPFLYPSGNTTNQDLEYAKYEWDLKFDKEPFDITLNTFAFPSGYTNGALKGHFNPISDKWEFNYKPNPDGGFFSHDLFSETLLYNNLVTFQDEDSIRKNDLAPIDLSQFTLNGKIQPYVRFNNSQYLDFSSLNKNDFIQQFKKDGSYVPDIMEELGNTNADNLLSLDIISNRVDGQDDRPQSVAFVRCELSENLYSTPKIVKRKVEVFGRTYNFETHFQSLSIVKEKSPGGVPGYTHSVPYAMPIFSVGPSGGLDETFGKVEIYDFYRTSKYDNPQKQTEKSIIDTSKKNLDTDHVYAIITLPDRILPTLDQRYMDGPYQAINNQEIKHILTQDVVRMPDGYGFDKPAPKVGKKRKLNCDNFTLKQLSDAQAAQKEAISSIGFASSNVQIGFTHPSPVYPDLVALPLMSTERCYGPWISSAVSRGNANDKDRFIGVGGKVSFIKNENIAPWNYGGYRLMDDAGALEAEFSNGLLLFSERGGFTMTDAPTSIGLALPIASGGPLVTSISVDVSDSIKTTVKMDLYTPRFGKLNKYNQDYVSRIAKDRQSIIDIKNQLARRDISRSMSNTDLLRDVRANGQFLFDLGNLSQAAIQRSQDNPDIIVISVNEAKNNLLVTRPNSTSSNRLNIEYNQKYIESSLSSRQDIEQRASIIANNGDINSLNVAYQKTAGQNLSQFFTPYSSLPNPYMPYMLPYKNNTNLDERKG